MRLASISGGIELIPGRVVGESLVFFRLGTQLTKQDGESLDYFFG